MLTYLTAFIFYTLAMVGILLVGFIVYKKTFASAKSENKGLIKIVDSLMIAPKKMLLVVKIKNERFLIASGAEHTTFLAKLNKGQNENEISLNDLVENQNKIANFINPPKEKRIDEGLESIPFYKSENQYQYQKNNFQDELNDIENIKRAKALEAQRQFKELYEKEDENENEKGNTNNILNKKTQKYSNKKDLYREILKTLNAKEKTMNYDYENDYNKIRVGSRY